MGGKVRADCIRITEKGRAMKKKADKIFRNGNAVYMRTATNSALLSAHGGPIPGEGDTAHEILTAIGKLSELDNCSQLRQDAIRNGKAIIANWHSPTGEEIDVIIANMKKRLLA